LAFGLFSMNRYILPFQIFLPEFHNE
jgi:hypothetical protein